MDIPRTVLAVLVALLALGCDEAGRSRGSEAGIPDRVSPAIPLDATVTIEPAVKTARVRLPGLACLTNKFGIRRKVIARVNGVTLLDRPGGRPTRDRTHLFMPYFLFEQIPPEGTAQWYRIGRTPRDALGWIPASAAAEWDTRVGARQIRDDGGRSPPLLVYPRAEDLLEWLANGRTAAQPIARAVPRGGIPLMPWPIVEARSAVLNGRSVELLRLHFLGEFVGDRVASGSPGSAARSDAYSAEEVAAIRSGVRQCDVVFVVDNTRSTKPFLDAIRDTLKRMATEIDSALAGIDIRFGLVLYRDHVPEIMYTRPDGFVSVTRSFPLMGRADFVATVDPLQEAQDGSIDWPEAVYDGLQTAIVETAWRGRGLSERLIVLVGDNSAHEVGEERNPKGLGLASITALAGAKENHVSIFSLAIAGAGGEEEQRRHLQQFEQLARSTGGECRHLDRADEIVSRIVTIVRGAAALVEQRSTIVDAKVSGDLPRLVARGEVDPHLVTQVMEFLRNHGDVDFERLGPGVPAFASGWILSEVQGTPTVEKMVYVAREELALLVVELDHLSGELTGAAPVRLFEAGVDGREGTYFSADRAETLDVWLRAHGVPCHAGSLLQLTPAEVRHMPEARRAALLDRIRRQILPDLLKASRDNDAFTYVDTVEFGWIREALLP